MPNLDSISLIGLRMSATEAQDIFNVHQGKLRLLILEDIIDSESVVIVLTRFLRELSLRELALTRQVNS